MIEFLPWYNAVAEMSVCTDPDCTIRKPGFPPHGPHDFIAGKRVT